MQTHLLSYGSGQFEKCLGKIKTQADHTNWFDTVTLLSKKNLPIEYLSRYGNIGSRGDGFWSWKPWIIHEKISSVNKNDIVVYVDSVCIINKKGEQRFRQYIDMLQNSDLGVISFQFTSRLSTPDKLWREKYFTYNETFEHFNIPIDSHHRETGQIVATVLVFKANDHAKFLCDMWLAAAKNRIDLFTDTYVERNRKINKFFRDNRHDQSVFSVLRKKYDSIMLTDETLFPHGLGDESFYDDNSNIKYPFWKYKPHSKWKFR